MGSDLSLLESGVRWRSIGPFRGGRVVAVAGDPVDAMTFYFGACGGGVWKTTDGGTYWENISDDFFNTAAVGAIAVADSDRNVIYAGTGEACIRGNVTHGDGVYRSTDAGQELDAPRPLGHATHRAGARPSAGPGHGIRRGAGPRLRPERGAGRLPLAGRGEELGARPLRQRGHGGGGPVDRPEQPAHHLRDDVAGAADALESQQRGAGVRNLQELRRRRHLDRSDRQPGSSRGT